MNLGGLDILLLFAGPIFVLAQTRDAGELEITDDVLRATFDGVCRSVLPTPDGRRSHSRSDTT